MMTLVPMVLVVSLTVGASRAVAGAPTVEAVSVRVTNPLPARRPTETVALKIANLVKLAPTLDLAKTVVRDGAGQLVASQLVDMDGDEKPDDLVFQAEFGAAETKAFVVGPGRRRPAAREEFRVYGRFVRERHDDFAWENDHIAHRMYGPDLETWKAEPLTSSGVDVWCKRVRKLVVNDWYMTDNYHQDGGEGADFYSVGKSRGCGGTALFVGDKPTVSRNFVGSRVLANGPIRLVFDLTYAPWDVGGRRISETKRVVVDAGQNFDRFESTFETDGPRGPLSVGVGIAKHEGGVFALGPRAAWLQSWEPLKKPNGNLGCAIVLPPRTAAVLKQTDSDQYLVVTGGIGVAHVAYAGFAWDRSGDVADQAGWATQVERFARGLAAPLVVALTATKVPAAREDAGLGGAGAPAWAARTCDAVMARGPVLTDKWTYDAGLVLNGCVQVWRATKNNKYLEYVKRTVDGLIGADGGIRGYKLEDYNLDNINTGKVLFPLLAQTATVADKDRYRKALFRLRSQLRTQPRTSDGGFWHKGIYAQQMWLDGVYMASPFLAEFGVTFDEPGLVDEAAKQILLAETHLRDAKTGLLYHGWNESKEQRWADPKTGTSSQFWGRAMGWYAMAVVDVLEYLPARHPRREAVMAVLGRLAGAIASVQDRTSGVWWQVLNAPGRGNNYEEASASAMFVYALGKAVKNGWIDAKQYGPVAARGYAGILAKFVDAPAPDQVNVKGICKVAGLGGDPYRDGSFAYYTSTEVVANDPKGVGAFILASVASE